MRWAKRKAGVRNKKPALVSIYFDDEKALPCIESFTDDIRWGRFIINNRNGLKYVRKIPFQEHNLDARYMITCGRIADIEIVDVADELLKSGEMLMLLDRILNQDYSVQYAFHTNDANDFIKKITYRSLV